MVRARITRACITTDHGEDDGSGDGTPQLIKICFHCDSYLCHCHAQTPTLDRKFKRKAPESVGSLRLRFALPSPPLPAVFEGSSVIRFENFYKDGSWLSVVLPKYMLLPVEDLHGPVRSGGRWTLPLFDTPPPTSSNERVCNAIDRNKDGIDYTGFHGSRQDLDLKL
ncbi:unnamed protein product [Spirodela intermedia]|uniref:Uncharacterized protein n=1 Tax=Spirodela intermedia TaxID=51605 RepID=A0A7I8LD72_SPIIN|nr:unnamed protein product [Spirodela intermedia]